MASATSPVEQVLQVCCGYIVTRCFSAIAELGIPDVLANGPQTIDQLADKVGANPEFLNRVMRTLVSNGLIDEPSSDTYAQTPVSDLLRADHPQSMRELAMIFTAKSHWQPLGNLPIALRTGKSAVSQTFGMEMWDWFQQPENIDEWNLFNSSMTSFSAGTSVAVAESYDFSSYRRIIDVGGGHGFLLKTVLAKAPNATGVICDLPDVVAGANREELGKRIDCVGADFFETVPADGDCYMLKHIIHDWDDARSQKILSNIANAMTPDGRVLIVDMVVPDERVPHPSYFLDITMLCQTIGGRERTKQQFENLLAISGLKLKAIHPTASPVSVVEAIKA